MKLACMELIWGGVEAEKFEPWLHEVAAIGYAGIGCREVFLRRFFDRPDEFQALLTKHKLELASVYTPVHIDFVQYEQLLRFMKTMGCANLVLCGGRAVSKEDREPIVKLFSRIADFAREYGVIVMHHHHTHTLAETREESEQLLTDVPSKNFFCFCDTGHATKDFIKQPVKERALGFLERNWERVRYIECKDWTAATEFSTDLGHGDADFAAIFPLLHERHYRGWITVEQNSPSAGSTPAECARRAFELLSKHLNATLQEKSA